MSSISPSTQITHKQSLKISETPRNGAAKSYMLPILLDLHNYLFTYCIIFGKHKTMYRVILSLQNEDFQNESCCQRFVSQVHSS